MKIIININLFLSPFLDVGFGFIYLPTVIDLKRNSSKFASLMPIAAIGTYAGIVTCPGIVELFLRNYGLHAAFCLFGAMLWNIIPSGLLLSDKVENEHVPHKSTVNSVIHKEQSVLTMATTTEPGLEHKGGLKQTLLQVQSYTGRVFTIFTDTLYALKEQYDIFRDTVFVLFFIISNMRKFISESWILFLIPYSQEIGLDKTSAVIVGSVGDIGGIIGRLVAAVSFSEKCSLPPLTMFALYYFMIALVFAAFERVGNILYLSACAFLSGLFISAHAGMMSGLLLELFGHKDFVRAFAVIDFGCGVFSLLSGYLTGESDLQNMM